MFGNQLVTYGGPGSVRRGLVWQSGGIERNYVTGHLSGIAEKFRGYYPYGEILWYKEKSYASDPWVQHGPFPVTGKHPYVKDGKLYIGNWERFNECHFTNAIPKSQVDNIKNAGFNPIYPQWGGSDPNETPYLNLWSQDPANNRTLYYLPSVNKLLERMTFDGLYTGVSYARAVPDKYDRYDEDWIYEFSGTTYYSGLYSDVAGGFIQATKFSKEVYLVSNGKAYDTGGLGVCEFRIAKEVDLYFFSRNYYWFHLLDMPIPTALITLDE